MNLEGMPLPPGGLSVACAEQLIAESNERKATLLKLQDEIERLRAETEINRWKLNAQLRRMGNTVLDLTEKHAGQVSATRRACGQVVQLTAALRALVDVCNAVREEEGWNFPEGQFEKRIREATELLSLVEVPFG